jgi:iron complex outermembrane receptor protein
VLTIFNARGDYRDPISYLPFHIVNQTAEAGLRGTEGRARGDVGRVVEVRGDRRSDGLGRGLGEVLPELAIADTLSILDDRVLLTLGGRWQSLDVNSYSATTGYRTREGRGGVDGVHRRGGRGQALDVVGVERQPLPRLHHVSRQTEVGAKYDFGTVGVGFAAFEIEQPSGFLDFAPTSVWRETKAGKAAVALTAFTGAAGEVRPSM